MTSDTTVILRRHEQQARIALRGAALEAYEVGGVPVVAPVEMPQSAYAGAVLAPWPNRVANGRWNWHGEDLGLVCNDRAGRTALHGLVSNTAFEVCDVSTSEVRLQHDLLPTAGYPFALRLQVSYVLLPEGLVCTLSAVNVDDQPVPVALGAHPYLDTRGDVADVTLEIPGTVVLEVTDQWEELSRKPVERTWADFLALRTVGVRPLDSTWTNLVRGQRSRVECRLGFPNGDQVVLWGGRGVRYITAYTGEGLPAGIARRSIAIEPLTAPANAFRSGSDLTVLAPGEDLTLEWGLGASWLEK